jgi:serine protease Do
VTPIFDKLKQQKVLSFALLLFTLILGIVIGSIINTGVKAQRPNSAVAPDATPLTIPSADPISNEFNKLTKKVEPSVVYIESDYLPKAGAKQSHKSDEDEEENGDTPETAPKQKDPSEMFKRFFGGSEPRSFRSEGSGTGFIVDRNGYILTNYHVVENADRIKVKVTGDEGEYRGRVVGFDIETDVAVLKVDVKHSLTPVQIGNSDAVQVGDWVIAIGSPFGLQATVTAGIISAQRTSRDLPGAKSFQNFLQTDAAINPGNSGGPLLNIRGEVIGINTMIATRGGSYEGVGFALPSNMAAKVYNGIIRDGRVVRGSIGVKFKTENQASTLEAFGLDHGVMVDVVSDSGPAGKAGIQADDIITALNGKPVKDGADLISHVADMPIGSAALLTVDRNGKRIDFKVAIGERSVVWKGSQQVTEFEPKESGPVPALNKTPASAKFGITIQRLSEKERQDLSIEDKSGVKVVSVDPGSFADDIGMQDGDTILSINRLPVMTPDDVMKVQASFKPGQPIAVHVARSLAGGKHVQPQRFYLSGHLPSD